VVGAVVFTPPAIRGLRGGLPDARLHYLVEEAAAPIVAGNPHLDRVVIGPRRRGLGRLADDLTLARELRRERYDVVIDFHGGPRASALAWASGAARRIGYTGTGRGWMYTHLVARARELRPRHSVENQWDLLAPLGAGIPERPDPRRDPVEMAVDAAAAARVAARLTALGITAAHELIVAHVSAGSPFRRWSEKAFAELVAGLVSAQAARRVILSAGPSDRDAAARIRALALTHRGVGALRCPRPASSRSRSCARCSIAPRCSSAATRVRCTSRRRPACRSSESTGRRCRRDPRRGAIRSSPPRRWRSGRCPAGRASSGSARRAISAA
jgi:ADP-heptose:LPS heptosyltransferase